MTTEPMTLQHLIRRGLGDSSIHSLSWDANEEDFHIQLDIPSEGLLRLTFVWATNLLVDLRFGQYSGYPLLHKATLTQHSQDRWSVAMYFGGAPNGQLTLECTAIRVQRE